MASEVTREIRRPGRYYAFLVLVVILLGVIYEGILIFTPLLSPYRFPIPYAVPIFDFPFAFTAMGVGYLCLERHRLRQDFQSASLGVTLWLASLLAFAHILTQPDYPGAPGPNPGVAPYFFFLSYLSGFAGIALATHRGDRPFPLSDRARFWIGAGVLGLALLMVLVVIEVRPLLPSLVMKPGRLTPFAIYAAGVANGVLAVWGLWGARKRFFAKEQDWFAGVFLLAAFIWLLGLLGFLFFPFRYAVSWYLAGLARPIGVGVIFVGLVREQVWLYREARARMRDLERLHAAGRALVSTLDAQQIVDTVTAKAVELSGAEAAVLFRLDAQDQVLRAVSRAGAVSQEYVTSLEVPMGFGLGGLAVKERRPVWTSNLQVDDRVALSAEVRARVCRERFKAALAIPLASEGGQLFGTLSVYFREERVFAATDVELFLAYGTQAAVALQNARAFEHLALKARNDATLREFSQRLLETATEEAILDEAVRVTQDLVDADCVALFLFDPTAGHLHLKTGRGWEPGTVGVLTLPPSAEPLAGQVFLRREYIEVEDLSQNRRFSIPPHLAAHGVRAGAVVPFGVGEQPIGVLGAYWRGPHLFSEEQRRVLLNVANQTGLVLEKIRLYGELRANLQQLQETQAQLIQADKLTALGTLLSGMAHELNTPLTSILLSAQLLNQQDALHDSARRRMGVVEQEAKRASQIVKDLLVFARRNAPDRAKVDLNTSVNATLVLQAPEFNLNNIRVVTDLDPNLPAIWADPHQLQQVFLNLFTNATDAMASAHSRGTLTVRSSRLHSGVCVILEDDGPGIPPEYIRRVFDPFFTTKGAGKGTGLGLSVSLGIMESHGGRIKAENVPGRGARFTVELPVGEEPEPAIETPAGELLTVSRRAEVLVVDDNPNLRALLADVLDHLGHDVESASTGHEAIDRLEERSYDVITLDLRLPDIPGQEVWRWILRQDPALATRVVFVTGDTLSPETQDFLQQAGRPVLAKPFTVERIQRIVDHVLSPSGVGSYEQPR